RTPPPSSTPLPNRFAASSIASQPPLKRVEGVPLLFPERVNQVEQQFQVAPAGREGSSSPFLFTSSSRASKRASRSTDSRSRTPHSNNDRAAPRRTAGGVPASRSARSTSAASLIPSAIRPSERATISARSPETRRRKTGSAQRRVAVRSPMPAAAAASRTVAPLARAR